MKVTVTQGVQVSYDGTVYRDGASADVPDSVADRWVANGWASPDGPLKLRDPRGLTLDAQGQPVSNNEFHDAVDAESDDESAYAVESVGPGPAKAKATKRVRRDPRVKGTRDAEQ